MVTSHPLLTAALLALGVALTTTAAAAQDATAAARAAFEQGIRLASEQRWAEALAAFERSRASLDRPSTAYNAALALQHLGRMIEARRALEQCLAMPDTAEEPEFARDANEVLTAVRGAIGDLTLRASPEHAALRVDGADTGLLGPSRRVELDPGHRVLTLSARGYAPRDLSLDVALGAREEREVTLVPEPARLAVRVTPDTASVFVDGVPHGRGAASWEGPPHSLWVRVTAAGYVSSTREMTLGPGESAQLAIALTREPRPISASPWLWVGVGATVAAVVAVVAVVSIRVTADPDGGTANRVLSGGP